MEEIFKMYEQKWASFSEVGDLVDYTPITNSKMLSNPFEYLPKEANLSKEELKELKDLESGKGDWGGVSFLKMRILQLQRGWAHKLGNEFKIMVEKFEKYCNSIHVTLPKNYIKFIQNPNLIYRIRFSDSFRIPEKLYDFPYAKGLYFTELIMENQGGCWWYLLMDKEGNNCVLFSHEEWHFNCLNRTPPDSFEFFICAHSFEDFIIRLSNELKKSEEKNPYKERIKRAEERFKNLKS